MTLQTIPVFNLALAFIPVGIVVIVMFGWSLKGWQALYALVRMVFQLLLIGYVLVFIFEADSPWFVAGILAVMIVAASWISLNPISDQRSGVYLLVFLSLLAGCGLTLIIVTQGVLQLSPWFTPQFMIPLAGMIFANSMNTVSLA
ncbi:MAG: ABC transporter permease, partial [Gammaproteobacteria bacterium]|nr:ABC transporter permease [Gammaproteobacteria bacterium]